MAVLTLLERREMYGYELVEALERDTGGHLAMGQSTVYPLLYNLEGKGHVASVTRQALRSQDVVGRYGGDEIAILLGGTPLPGATTLLERVRTAIQAEPIEFQGKRLSADIRAGVAEVSEGDGDGRPALARAAAAAATAARRGGHIAIAEAASPSAETRVGPVKHAGPADRLEAGVTLGGMYQIVHEINNI